jgi:hypothetical protein
MKGPLFVVAGLTASLAIVGCGGGGGKVSSASLQPRLLPSSSTPGFGLQRTQDWSDPVNLVGEGLALPQRTRPSEAVKEFTSAHFEGAAGEVLASGTGLNETAVRVGVAKFDAAGDANRVRDWMHREDLKQPCYSQCVFAPGPVSQPDFPSMRLVVQSGRAPLPPGAPPAAKAHVLGPANYLAEFTIGPYLYWATLQANSGARTRFEQGIKLYYAHAKQQS